MAHFRLPFRNMAPAAWQRLGIAALLLIYTAQIVLEVVWGNLFGNLGVDFAAFWSAGHIANHYGYGAVYNLEVVAEVQRQFLPARALLTDAVRILPTAYLPLFLLPFQALALLPPAAAAIVWIALNFLGGVLYIRHFAVSTAGRHVPAPLLMLLIISIPIFQNTFLGQANLWLMICVGEFILAYRAGREFRSGVWLAGLLLKPQCLLLIVPAILLQRRWKAAAGILLAGTSIIVSSWLLAGTAALADLARLWIGYVGGLPTNDPQLMMNWRMIGVHLQGLVGSGWAQTIVFAGMAVTILAALALSMRRFEPMDPRSTVVILGVMAATTMVSWHSHVHMAMVLVPPLLALAVVPQLSFGRVLNTWVWLPAVIYVFRILLAALERAGSLRGATFGVLDLLGGLGLFVVDLVLVVWALTRLKPWSRAESGVPS
jgi:hypothetical protein